MLTCAVFKFLTALVDMPQECQKYRLQLIIEYNRVLAWGKAAGLVDVPEGSTLAATLGTEATELIAIVARIQWLLSEFRDLNSRYGNELNPKSDFEEKHARETTYETGTDEGVVQQVSSLAVSYEKKKKIYKHRWGRFQNFLERAGHNTKDIVTHPKRVRWLAIDEEQFQNLLQDLHVLTERLHELMRGHREKMIDDITAKTYREMIVARNDIQGLRDMLDAVGDLIATSSSTRKEKDAHRNDRTLQDLVQLKKIGRISDSILAQLAKNRALDVQKCLDEVGVSVPKFTAEKLIASFQWNDDEYIDRPRGILNKNPVWIEWKIIGDIPEGHPKDKEMALRTVALAEMLHMQKPGLLHAPECVGYFDDREISHAERYGWIFKMPNGSDFDTQVVSFYDILGVPSRKPSLSQRVVMALKLCSTVLNLHAVNWLHKGIFSSNVVFHFNGTIFDDHENILNLGTYDAEKPILSGFEFSRPDGSKTTAREANPMWNLYRWPSIQQEAPTERNSRKTYDLYSLGLVLLEIAHWQPLDKLLLLGETERGSSGPTVKHSKLVREWLLGTKEGDRFEDAGQPNPLLEVRNLMGDRYWRAVERCLWAHGERGFGVEERDDQSNDSRVGTLLQEAFTTHVVEELEAINI